MIHGSIKIKDLFITATNTDVGKTYTTVKLLHKFSSLGYRVGAFKPIETGVENTPIDATILLKTCQELNSDFNKITLYDICPIQLSLPAAPYVANCAKAIDFKKIKTAHKKLKNSCDILLIEGAGGLLVPVEQDFYVIDFIKWFDAYALLVTHDKLGSINETLLSLEALQNRKIPHTWCINHFGDTKAFEEITLPFYKAHFNTIYRLQKHLDPLVDILITHCNSHRDR